MWAANVLFWKCAQLLLLFSFGEVLTCDPSLQRCMHWFPFSFIQLVYLFNYNWAIYNSFYPKLWGGVCKHGVFTYNYWMSVKEIFNCWVVENLSRARTKMQFDICSFTFFKNFKNVVKWGADLFARQHLSKLKEQLIYLFDWLEDLQLMNWLFYRGCAFNFHGEISGQDSV